MKISYSQFSGSLEDAPGMFIDGKGRRLTAQVTDESVPAETASVAHVRESGEYERAVRGVDIRAVQTQRVEGHTTVSTTSAGRVDVTRVSVGSPFMSSSVINEDALAVSLVIAKGSVWCGDEIEAGDVLIHGPEALHTASNPEGFAVTFAVVPVQEVGVASSSLGSRVDHLTGRFVRLPPGAATSRLGLAIAGAFGDTPKDHLFAPPPLESLPSAVADAIDASYGDPHRTTGGRINDAAIVTACIERAEAIGRVPGLAEMRLAAHVSERRLRRAFVHEYGVPPARFFRRWALDRARRHLLERGDDSTSVTRVALDVGFRHLGRFAAYYRSQFGELPSATLGRSTGGRPPLG